MKKIFLLLFLSSFLFSKDYVIQNVPVIESIPIINKVKTNIPYQECYEVKVYEQEQNSNTIGVDTLLGGLAGVVIGNQIGKGNGRDAAKVVGGIGGALLANKMRDNNSNNNIQSKEKCKTVYKTTYEEKIVGYENYFDLNGEKRMKKSQIPLNSINITISYSW